MKHAFLLACLTQFAAAGEFSAIKTATGILVAHEDPENRFTVEIPGNTVEPLEHPQHFFLKIDGVPIQVQTVSRDQIFGKPVLISPKDLLLAHRDWEKRNIEKMLNAKLTLENALVPMNGDTDALSWSFSMPKGMDAEVGRQLYLTRANGDRVIVLNAAVLKGTREDAIRKTLIAAASSFRKHDAPIDLADLRKAANDASPATADAMASGGTYEFPLNHRGGGIRIVSGARPPRLEFYDDHGDGIEITWDSPLAPQKDLNWQTDRGLVVSVEQLAKPVTSGGKQCGWKLKISGRNPGFREHQKARPQMDFGDAENNEYFGNLVSPEAGDAVPEKEAARTPPAGSPERTAIMDVLRLDFYRDPEKARENPDKILFKVHHLKVANGWACVNATPTRNGKDAGEPRWAVLHRRGGTWEDVDYFKKLGPLPSEEAAMDALAMSAETVKRLIPKLPGCPQDIFPSAAR